MNVTGLTFLFVFLPIVIVLYYNPIIKNRTFKNILLLFASLGFYICLEPIMIALLLVTILINYTGTKLFIKTTKSFFKAFSIAFDFILLLGFKYINIVLDQVGLLMNSNSDFIKIAMPLGISYYTFNAISYVVDSCKSNETGSLLETSLYISFFGKMSSGPIVQYNDMIGEIKNRTESFDMFCLGLQRFSIGLIKKILIADSIAHTVTICFSTANLSVLTAWFAAMVYTLQLYFDFSGCTDMAIGIGNMFGFKLVENFNYPYSAVSVSDFWKRWHMSLTKWFTRYIYIPLGGNRVTKPRHILNITIVWLLTGIWHGANWTFIIWGMVYCAILLLEKFTSLKTFAEKHKIFGHIYTMLVVVLLWVVFRADSLESALNIISAMFGIGVNGFVDDIALDIIKDAWVPLVIAAIFALPVKDKIYSILGNKSKLVIPVETLVTIVLSIVAICVCVSNGANGSVSLYANF